MLDGRLERGAVSGGVVVEEVPPRGVDAGLIGEVLLIDLVHEPLVGPEALLLRGHLYRVEGSL